MDGDVGEGVETNRAGCVEFLQFAPIQLDYERGGRSAHIIFLMIFFSIKRHAIRLKKKMVSTKLRSYKG